MQSADTLNLPADQVPDIIRSLALAALVSASYGDEFSLNEAHRFANLFESLGGVVTGRCVHCGCTELAPCLIREDGSLFTPTEGDAGECFTCGWVDATRTLCNAPACLDRAANGPQKTIVLVAG